MMTPNTEDSELRRIEVTRTVTATTGDQTVTRTATVAVEVLADDTYDSIKVLLELLEEQLTGQSV